MEPTQIVQSAYQAFGQGDIPTMLGLMSDDFEWDSRYTSNVPFGGVWKGHDGVMGFLQALTSSADIQNFGILGMVSEGDKVVVLGFEEAIGKATGTSYRNEWVHVWTIAEGKLKSIRSYNDTATAAAAYV